MYEKSENLLKREKLLQDRGTFIEMKDSVCGFLETQGFDQYAKNLKRYAEEFFEAVKQHSDKIPENAVEMLKNDKIALNAGKELLESVSEIANEQGVNQDTIQLLLDGAKTLQRMTKTIMEHTKKLDGRNEAPSHSR